MLINQFDIWIADLSPQLGTEPGKTRPVLVIQSDLLNKAGHPSTVICPVTTNVAKSADLLRVHLSKGAANIKESSDIMIDQIRAIDNKRLISKIGTLPPVLIEKVRENISIILDLDF